MPFSIFSLGLLGCGGVQDTTDESMRLTPTYQKEDLSGVLSELLDLYEIPYLWDAEKHRILIGSSDIVPRYSQDKFAAEPGVPAFELALQGANSPIILLGVIHRDEAYCQVLEFADELGISATFNPFALHERRGG